ncbi:hypothetical protein [Paenibacillus sp. GCM10027626]|uniref:hypothetical protein n=1 Tax=Paenibacillus sp. GCM10027626 TaxID=3273411 RepID=UPI0036284197
MHELLQAVLHETELLSRLEQTEDNDYERFERLVDLRQALVDQIAEYGKLLPSQKQAVKAIMEYDSIIVRHMERMKEEAQEGLLRINNVKRQKAAYDNSSAYDAIMFDKRN